MIFNSFTYVIFLAIVVALYWILPRSGRLILLFGASVLFYGFWSFAFVPLMLVSVVTDYVAAIVIDNSHDRFRRRMALFASLFINLGLLVFFKYYYFLSENVSGLGSLMGADLSLPVWKIILPIGISFYTFQSISYTIDVYRGYIKPCREFILFADYVMFFPQLIAGPILRAREVIWQLDERPKFKPDHIAIGIRRIIIGLFLKVVLADHISGWVDAGYSAPVDTLSAPDVLTLAFLFGFQIYFDFAAYSHIAIGSAKLMGIDFPENFNFPYAARSPREFWQRWHISLSSWIRDYLYLPLTGAKVEDRSTGGLQLTSTDDKKQTSEPRIILALFLTWAIMGLWHGAAWAFVLWGVWHAVLVLMHRMTGSLRARFPLLVRNVGGWAITLPLVMLGWIPFRTGSLSDTLTMWKHLVSPERWFFLGLRENIYLLAALTMMLVVIAPFVKGYVDRLRFKRPLVFSSVETVALTFIVAVVLVYLRPINQFIYFQF